MAPSQADRAAAPPARPWWPVPAKAAPGKARKRRLGRLRLAAVPDASAESLAGFLAGNVAPPAAVTTDGWQGYGGLGAAGYEHEAINLSRCWGDAVLRLPAIHLVFGLAKRWLLGTHHGRTRGGVDELRGDADRVGPLDAAFEHVAHAQLPADLLHVHALALVDEGRVAGDDEEVGAAGDAVAPNDGQLQGGIADPQEGLPRAAELLELGEDELDGIANPLVRIKLDAPVLAPDQARR